MIIHCLYDKLIPIAELKAHPKNRNKHPKEQIERLAKILNYQGWRYPVKVSKLSGFITSGHGRIEAAKLNGWESVPVNFQDYETSDQEYMDVQSDNAIASWAELDVEGIQLDMKDLPDLDVDLLGIEGLEVVQPEKLEPQCDEDDMPEQVEPKTKLGDIYQLGRHRLMCGDSTSIDAVEKLMNGEKADITFTSPPYNVGSTPGGTNPQIRYRTKDADDKSYEDYLAIIEQATLNAIIHSEIQFINLGWYQGNKLAIIDWLHKFRAHYCDLIIWDKGGSNISPNEVLNARFECIFAFRSEEYPNRSLKLRDPLPKGMENLISINSKDVGNVDTFGTSQLNNAKFPVEFPEWAINSFNPKSVLDLFGGSGSTLIACEKTNRKCFMSELDPHYCDVIVARWEKYTGKKAELITNGQTP